MTFDTDDGVYIGEYEGACGCGDDGCHRVRYMQSSGNGVGGTAQAFQWPRGYPPLGSRCIVAFDKDAELWTGFPLAPDEEAAYRLSGVLPEVGEP